MLDCEESCGADRADRAGLMRLVRLGMARLGSSGAGPLGGWCESLGEGSIPLFL